MTTLKTWVAAASMLALTGAASAGSFFEGRLADGAASATCTSNGAGGTTKCAMFYNTTLNITILNDWNIGRGAWSGSVPPAAGSAQALAESAGDAQTDFTGWFLPTGAGRQAAGALNQYRSIWNDVGGTLAGLQAQFDGVQFTVFWSGTEQLNPNAAWYFDANGDQNTFAKSGQFYAVAVRPGDVVAVVPEPQTYVLLMLGLGAVMVAARRRPR